MAVRVSLSVFELSAVWQEEVSEQVVFSVKRVMESPSLMDVVA